MLKIGERREVEIPTGGSPLMALLQARHDLGVGTGAQVVRLTVHHDPGCPCLRGQPMPACTCELIGLKATRVA
jgi:hypothetical protein